MSDAVTVSCCYSTALGVIYMIDCRARGPLECDTLTGGHLKPARTTMHKSVLQ